MQTLGALAFLLLGAAVPAVLLAKLWRDRHLSLRGVTGRGEIVAVSQGGDSDWAIIVFRDARNRAHQFRSDVPYPAGAVRVGAPVAVRYDPDDPRRVRELGRPAARALHAVSWIFVGTVSGIIGVQLLPV
jgi:hypothetical protein